MTRTLKNCVTHGRRRCARPYAEAREVRGPRRCHIGSGGMVLGTGIGSSSSGCGFTSFLFSFGFGVGVGDEEYGRPFTMRNVGRPS
jgi:hypothetical protein